MPNSFRVVSRPTSIVIFMLAFCAAAIPPRAASAVTNGTWTDATSGGLWSNSGNWFGGIADGADGTADFSTLNIVADNTVHLDTTNRVIGNLIFGDTTPSNNWTLDNNGISTNILTLSVSVAGAGTPTITVNNQTATISAALAGTEGLTVGGLGTLVLSGTNTYTGATIISSGALKLEGNSGSLNSTSDLTLNGGGTFNYQGRSIGSSQSLGKLSFSAGEGVVQSTYGSGGNTSLTFTALASRAAGATGTFIDSGGTPNGPAPTNKIAFNAGFPTNSFIDQGTFFSTGGGANYAWYDSAGFLRAINYSVPADNGATSVTTSLASLPAGVQFVQISGNGAVTNQNSGFITTLNLVNGNNFTLTAGSTLTLSGILKSGNSAGGLISGGALKPGGATDLVIRTDQPNDTLTISSQIQGAGTNPLTKSGAGKLILGGSNAFSGTVTIDAGTLQLGSTTALSFNPVAFAAGSTGILSLAGNSITINGLSTSATAAGAPLVQNGSGTAATLTISDNNPDTFAGVLQDGSGGGSLGLIKTSAPLILTGASTYTGATTVNGGRLILGLAGSLGNTPISVAGGANFSVQPGSGNNSAGGSLTLNAGAQFDMGDSAIGTFRLTAAGTPLTIAGAGLPGGGPTLTFEIGNAAAGTDKIAVTGNVAVQSGGGQIAINPLAGDTSITLGNYNLITAANGFSGSGGNGFILNTNSVTLGNGRAYNFSLANSTSTAEILTVTAGTPSAAYWNGAASGTWNTLNTGGVTNWRTDATNNLDTQQIPASTSNVFFTVNSSATNLTNALGADFTINSLTFTGSGTSAATGSVTIGGGNTLTIAPNSSSIGITVQSGSAAHNISSSLALGASQTWTNNSANSLMISGGVSGGSGVTLTIAGSGSIALSGVNTYAGGTTVASGPLLLGGNAPNGSPGTLGNNTKAVLLGAPSGNAAAAILTNGPYTVGHDISVLAGSSGMLTIGGSQTNGASTYTGGITLNQSATLAAAVGGPVTFSGTTSGMGGLVVIGPGTVGLTAANTYSGDTTVNGGTLSAAHFGNGDGISSVGTGILTINNSGTVSVDSTNSLDLTPIAINAGGNMTISIGVTAHLNHLTLAGGTLTDPAPNGSGNPFNHFFGYFNFDNNVTAGGSMITSLISAGDVALTTSGGTTFTINPGATNGIDLDFTGAITAPAGVTNTGLIKAGTGVMRLSNANSFIAGVTINAGTLLIGNAGALNSAAPNPVSFGPNSTGVLTLNGNGVAAGGLSTNAAVGSPIVQNASATPATLTINTPSGNSSYAGLLRDGSGGGALALLKTGAGLQAFGGANTFSGGTAINGGTLRAANATGSATGAGAVAVNSGGTLAGSAAPGQGFIGGPVNVAGGGSLAATSGATLTFSGGLTLQGGSSSTFALVAPNGTSNPLVNVAAGGLTVGGSHFVNIVSATQPGTYDLFAYTGAAPNVSNFTVINGTAFRFGFTLVNNLPASQIDLQLSPYTWTGQTGGTGALNSIWDSVQSNWAVGSNPVQYANGAVVSFTDTNAATGNPVNASVAINAGGVTPGSVTFNNAVVSYTLTNAAGAVGISGSTGVTIAGSAASVVTLANANTYTGPTNIVSGNLQLGDGMTIRGSLSASSTLTFGSAAGGGGAFSVAPGIGGGAQSLSALTFVSGDDRVISANSGGTTTLGFSSLNPRSAGATSNFIVSGGTNGSTNSITLAGVPAGFIDQGTFFDGYTSSADFGWMNAAGTYVRGINYGTDINSEIISASVNAFNVSTGGHLYEKISGSGAVTQQTSVTIASLNIANSNNLTLKANNTLTVNGILKSGNAAGGTISGGAGIQAGNNAELVVRTDQSSDTLTISTPILANGSNALTKSGLGTLTLSGAAANAYTGMTRINDGVLDLAKNFQTAALEGDLTIGDGHGAPGSAVVNILTGRQFDPANRPNVTVNQDGVLNLNNSDETLANITMAGGSITTGSQRFYNSGDLTILPSASSATINGSFYLYGFSGQTHTWTVAKGISAIDLDVSASIDGAFYNAPLVKTGPGALRLSGNNTLLSLALNAGTLAVGNDNALGAGTLIAGGGTLQADTAPHTLNNPITLNSSLIVAGSVNLTLSGALSGAGGLIKNGDGTLVLTAANSFTGGVAVNAGTLSLLRPNNDMLSTIGYTALTINNGGTVSIDSNNPMGFDGPEPAVTINAGGLLTAGTGFSQHFLGVTLAGGTVASSPLVATTIHFGTFNFNNNLTAGGATTTSVISALNVTASTPGGTTFTVNPGATNGIDLDVTGTIGAPTGVADIQNTVLIKAGTGAMRLTGANTFTAGLTLSAGTLLIGNDNALGTGTFTVAGGTFQADGAPHSVANAVSLVQDATIAGSQNLTLSGTVTLIGNRALTITNSAATMFSGVIGGSGGLTKSGTGTLTLAGANPNTFTGPAAINDGTLVLSKPDNVAATGNSLTVGDGIGAPGSAVVTLSHSYQLNVAGTSVAINSDGIVNLGATATDEIGSLTMTGGTLATGGDGYYFFLAGSVTTLASSRTATISSGYWPIVLYVGNDNGVVFNVAQGTTANGIDLDLAADFVNFQNLSEGIIKDGPGAMRISSGSPLGNEYSAGFKLDAGTVLIASDTALGTGTLFVHGGTIQADTAPRTVANPVSLTSTLTVDGGINLTLSGSISGSGGLVKNGTGTLTLSGIGTFTGPVTVNAGTLVQSGGALAADVVNQAVFTYNGGTFNGRLINYGALVLNADFTAGNGLENDSNLTLGVGPFRSVSLGGSGLDNEGNLTLQTVQFKLSSAATNVNRGNLNLITSLGFNGSGGTLTNSGQISLQGGFIGGLTSNLVNAGGTISGFGTIQSGFSNAGGLIAIGGGTINITQPFNNTGNIQLNALAAALAGGAITNSGTIGGWGNVGNAVVNTGTVAPLGGMLVMNNLSNRAAGLIRIAAGSQLLLTGGMAAIFTGSGENAGIINLTGGTFDNNGHALNNTGQISGYGTFATGGAGLDNNGSITFSGALTTINGPVTNENGRTITIAQNNALFTGLVTNNASATFNTVNAVATFAGGFVNNGNSNFVKVGGGVVEIDAAPTLNSGSTLSVTNGTMRFKLVSGTPTVGTGVTAVVSAGATLELGGSVSALANGANRVNLMNNSNAPGLLVTGTHQHVGNIDGTGTTQVNAGSDLTANHIIQSALVIGGAAKNPGLVTIDASDAGGNPQAQPSAIAGSLSFSGPLGADGITSASLSSDGLVDPEVPSVGDSAGGVNPSLVPEPTTLLLAVLAVWAVISTHVARRHFQCRTARSN